MWLSNTVIKLFFYTSKSYESFEILPRSQARMLTSSVLGRMAEERDKVKGKEPDYSWLCGKRFILLCSLCCSSPTGQQCKDDSGGWSSWNGFVPPKEPWPWKPKSFIMNCKPALSLPPRVVFYLYWTVNKFVHCSWGRHCIYLPCCLLYKSTRKDKGS